MHTGAQGRHGRPITVRDLIEMIRQDYEVNGRRSAARMETALRLHVLPVLGDVPVRDVSRAAFRYVGSRRLEQAAPATIHCELSVLGRMLTLAYRAGMIPARPSLPSIHLENARTGFFEPWQVRAVVRELPRYLADALVFALHTGWRRGEIFGLTWANVDLDSQTIRLEPGSTKNRRGRIFPYRNHEIICAVMSHRDRVRHGPYVFHYEGRRVRWFWYTWNRACNRAGVSGRVFHDSRRTAARSMERAGVPRTVAMRLIGLLTEEMYRRYAIVSERDLGDGVARLNDYEGIQR